MNLKHLKRLFLTNQKLSQIVMKNTSWMAMANIISKLFKFGMIAIIAREFGPSLFGNFNYVIVLSGTCFILSDIGLNLLITREIQTNNNNIDTLIATGFSIKLCLLALNILFAIACYFFIESSLQLPFIIFSIMNTVDGIKQYWITLNRAYLKQEHESIAFILETVLTSILGVLAIIYAKNITNLALAYLIGSLIASIYLRIVTRHLIESVRKTKVVVFKRLFIKMLPFTISIFLAIAITSIDTLMIKWLMNAKFVGLYNSGLKFLKPL